ncbi:MAG: DUF4198 domain-containing protein [Planctomycetes bacterium]|nr:DUF4198 domain-containing protein [Planctomycetota bacterium]
MNRTSSWTGLVCLLAFTARSPAHDFWIEPSTFAPRSDELVKVSLRVGDDFNGRPVLRDAQKIRAFIAVTPDGEAPVVGLDGSDPAGFVRVGPPGVYVIGYRSHRLRHELSPRQFEAYLHEEGLEQILAHRRTRGETEKNVTEVYSRCAKSLLVIGPVEQAGSDRRLGMTLELVAESSPWARCSGEPLTLKLLYDDHPLEGVRVEAQNRSAPDTRMAARTDHEGRVRFTIDQPGPWLIVAVHMVPVVGGADADWESFWASLTFDMPAANRARTNDEGDAGQAPSPRNAGGARGRDYTQSRP